MAIKAIETEYNGYRFRSRLEARWAVFFDVLHIKYEYEPEGYELTDGSWYLPDFYLPEQNLFFEVKGVMSESDKNKIIQFAKDQNNDFYVGYPDLSFEVYAPDYNDRVAISKSEAVIGRCASCGRYYFFTEWGSYECTYCHYYDGDSSFVNYLHGDWTESSFEKPYKGLKVAIDRARKARFEHGETQKPLSLFEALEVFGRNELVSNELDEIEEIAF